ncbi:hypothetical protein [Opitutus terrae]|uniref:Uncharacterized protein n=1 Tax=Opitutus terrae (strain DSM 11246 / JCM 15787 / PB90-1) TaxID=452637 RepID=B1ZTD7_OPITP|nr:hypothetical protein [Opitutus terrae]ACB76591.1 hypothetical protein Oter_3312 [Opitutus terrae PB90-1]
MKNVAANLRPWIAGVLTAFLGVALARVVAPSFEGNLRIYTTVAGQLLALTGLLILCLGIRRRIKHAVSAGATDHSNSNPTN